MRSMGTAPPPAARLSKRDEVEVESIDSMLSDFDDDLDDDLDGNVTTDFEPVQAPAGRGRAITPRDQGRALRYRLHTAPKDFGALRAMLIAFAPDFSTFVDALPSPRSVEAMSLLQLRESLQQLLAEVAPWEGSLRGIRMALIRGLDAWIGELQRPEEETFWK